MHDAGREESDLRSELVDVLLDADEKLTLSKYEVTAADAHGVKSMLRVRRKDAAVVSPRVVRALRDHLVQHDVREVAHMLDGQPEVLVTVTDDTTALQRVRDHVTLRDDRRLRRLRKVANALVASGATLLVTTWIVHVASF